MAKPDPIIVEGLAANRRRLVAVAFLVVAAILLGGTSAGLGGEGPIALMAGMLAFLAVVAVVMLGYTTLRNRFLWRRLSEDVLVGPFSPQPDRDFSPVALFPRRNWNLLRRFDSRTLVCLREQPTAEVKTYVLLASRSATSLTPATVWRGTESSLLAYRPGAEAGRLGPMLGRSTRDAKTLVSRSFRPLLRHWLKSGKIATKQELLAS